MQHWTDFEDYRLCELVKTKLTWKEIGVKTGAPKNGMYDTIQAAGRLIPKTPAAFSGQAAGVRRLGYSRRGGPFRPRGLEEKMKSICMPKKMHFVGKGVKFERIRRITGYLVGTLDRFNDAKRAEEHDRVKHGMGKSGRQGQ